MPIKTDSKSLFTQPGAYFLLLGCCWTFVVAVALLTSVSAHRQEILTIARNVTGAYIDKDILYRNWNALHGGIYVPVTRDLLPNPYYPPDTVERDLITPSGRRLTLVNPAYMTRQVYDLAQKEHAVSGRITSLNPLRPDNKPDAWEASALHSFERGVKEVSAVVTEDGIPYVRQMRSLTVEESCLPCHARQGYKKGDIRGGISVKLPMSFFEPAIRNETGLLWTGHAVMWFLGLVGLYAGYSGLRRRTEERDLAEDELLRVNALLENQATTDSLTGICNRRKFLELLQGKILEAGRYGTPLALIFFDIDHFKEINDLHGHEAGDRILQELVLFVAGMIRQTDSFARFGGEEFVILAPHDDVGAGCELAGKIKAGMQHYRFPLVGTVTCSFGVTRFCPDDTAESMIKRADNAMYAAKQGGRNRVVAG